MAENNYHVRDFRSEDFEAVNKLWEKTGMGGEERGDNLEAINRTIDCGGKLIMLIVDDEVVGSSWMTQDGRRVYLHHFSIDPLHRGLGLSHMLINTSLSWVRQTGLQVKLEVHESNAIANELYMKYGFQELDGYKVFIIRKP